MSVSNIENAMQPRMKLKHRLSIFDGNLLGFDGGEWGGQLIFLNADGSAKTLINQNIKSIIKSDNGVYAFTGLAHMDINEEAVWQIEETSKGTVMARPIIQLQGMPEQVQEHSAGRHVFQVFTGKFDSMNTPIFNCFQFVDQAIYPSNKCHKTPY